MMHISFPLAAMLAASTLAGTAAQAQVYRIVGLDGKVTFSDRAPDTQLAPTATRGGGAPTADAGLPYELRQVTTRYPVTLYTSNDCQPCNSARNLLIGRGVPFSERTITTSEDVEAFKRISGGTSLPFGTIGGQQLQGFSDAEWTQYLDLAGYPKQSQLPANYRRPAATPLVAVVEKKAPAPAPEAAPRSDPAPAAPTATPTNPAGIVF